MEAQPLNDNDDSDESSWSGSSATDSSAMDSSSTNSFWSEYSSTDASTDEEGDDPAEDRHADGSDVEEAPLEMWSESFGEAAQLLENNPGRLVSYLFVSAPGPLIVFETDADRPAAFARFVLALENAKCNVRSMLFEKLDWHGLPDDQLDRLFGRLLPTHTALEAVQFVDSEVVGSPLPAQWVQRLASSIRGNSSLTSVKWEWGSINPAAALAIAGMVRRDPHQLTHLVVTPTSNGGLDGDSLKVICDAVSHNTRLRHLEVRAKEVFADSLDGAVGPRSPLSHLCVYSADPFSRVGVTGLAERLKTNTALMTLQLFQQANGSDETAAAALRPRMDTGEVVTCLVDALDGSNFTITSLTVADPDQRMHEVEAAATFLARNRWIQRVLNELEVTDEEGAKVYKLEPAGLWPHAMAVTSGAPTPLYRLLRRGAVKDRSFSTRAVREGTTAPLNATDSVPPPQIQPPLLPWLQQQVTCMVQHQELTLGLLQQQTEHQHDLQQRHYDLQQRHYDLQQRYFDLQLRPNGAGSGSRPPEEFRQVERAVAAPLDYVEACPSSSDEVLTTGDEADDDTSVYLDAEQGPPSP